MAVGEQRPTPHLLVLDDWEGRLRVAPGCDRLRQIADVRVLDRPLADVADDELADVQVVLAIRERTRFDEDTLARLPRLELILQTGGHAYHVDPEAARRRGVRVALWRYTEACEAAMRELTFALAIAALRRFPEAARAVGSGEWPGLLGGTLKGRRLGILGMGRQGRAVAELGRAFGMEVVAWARTGSVATPSEGVRRLPLDELLATSDVVSIHLRLTDDSRGLLDAARLRSMKDGAVLVNTARGAIVDEVALVDVLRHGPLRAAGLDVFAHEPLPSDAPLRSLPNVVLTPHIGWTVEEAFVDFARGAADQLVDYLAHELDERELAWPADPRSGGGHVGDVARSTEPTDASAGHP